MESEIHKAYRIADLILRYRENTLSSAEAEELEYWLPCRRSTDNNWKF